MGHSFPSFPSFPLLLPTGSEEREELAAGSILVAILLSCHYVNLLPHN